MALEVHLAAAADVDEAGEVCGRRGSDARRECDGQEKPAATDGEP